VSTQGASITSFFLHSPVILHFFHHLVVGGGLDGHGILTASGGGTGAGIVAVVVVGGGLDAHGVLTASGGGTGAGVVAVVVVDGGLDGHGVCGPATATPAVLACLMVMV
jgi:hypothetical protein